MDKQYTPQEQKLIARIPAMRTAAVGLPYKIAISKKEYYQGTITDVQFGFFKYTARAVQLVFAITMECGSSKVLKTFNSATLPR